MSPLILVSLPLDMMTFHHWITDRNFGEDEGRALHHLLCECFGKGMLQPFRLMVASGAKVGNLYAYTRADRDTLIETARETGLPDALALCRPEQLTAKEMPLEWRTGRRIAFDLRVRPVKRLIKPAGKFAKGAEIDAYLVEKLRRFPEQKGIEGDSIVARADIYQQWLIERLGEAAEILNGKLARFAQVKVARRGSMRLEGPDAILHGELVVRDSGRFAECLARGVGRHTAYGYGMLLLRPARWGIQRITTPCYSVSTTCRAKH